MGAEKPLTIATYAAGASLAAITLVYVFAPTFILDGDSAGSSKSSSRRPAIGLYNPANDCFINSVLQALAGLPDLRKYLIRETHRRSLDGQDVYKVTAAEATVDGLSELKMLRLEGLRVGIVTQALKDILDDLNGRPIARKTLSAQPFIVALEKAFRTRISRQQQDAQEFLQVVAERLGDEYHAGVAARKKAIETRGDTGVQLVSEREDAVEEGTSEDKADSPQASETEEDADAAQEEALLNAMKSTAIAPLIEEDGFPLEGKIESQIECQTCGFKPKPSISTFVSLTLNVPQKSYTTLNQCFDGMLRVEVIEDYKCDKCRLDHALAWKKARLQSATDSTVRDALQRDISAISEALETDPEKPPEGVELPDLSTAPKRTIKKHMHISRFPAVLAIHLSRSIYDANFSSKNTAKVAFPELLPLGGIRDQKRYRLLCVVNHKGGHNSGHYETFRRQVFAKPFSTPISFGAEGAYSQSGSVAGSPRLEAQGESKSKRTSWLSSRSPLKEYAQLDGSPSGPTTSGEAIDSASELSSRSSFSLSRSRVGSLRSRGKDKQPPSSSSAPTSAPRPTSTPTSPVTNTDDTQSTVALSSKSRASEIKKQKKKTKALMNKWWRISDEKVKESRTSEVLGCQREVYMLFYELIGDGEADEED